MLSAGSGAPFARALGLLEDSAGRLWVGSEGLIAIRDGETWQLPRLPADLAATSVDALHQDRRGVVWVGSASPTRGGLWSFDGAAWRAVPAGVLPHPAVNMVTEDRADGLWVATGFANRGGAACARPGPAPCSRPR